MYIVRPLLLCLVLTTCFTITTWAAEATPNKESKAVATTTDQKNTGELKSVAARLDEIEHKLDQVNDFLTGGRPTTSMDTVESQLRDTIEKLERLQRDVDGLR